MRRKVYVLKNCGKRRSEGTYLDLLLTAAMNYIGKCARADSLASKLETPFLVD